MPSRKGILVTTVAITAFAAASYLVIKKRDSAIFGKCFSSPSACSSPVLQPERWIPFQVVENKQLNHDTHQITFRLPQGSHRLGLTVASALLARVPDHSDPAKMTIRPYTPTSTEQEIINRGSFDLIVKRYEQGNLSKHVCSLAPGEVLEMSGPIKKIDISTVTAAEIGMIAGGTGITPMLQVINHWLSHPGVCLGGEKKKITLIFANNEEQDILVRDKLEALQKKHPDHFKLHNVLVKPPSGWTQSVGYVTPEVLSKASFPTPSQSTMVLVCGPPPFMDAVSGNKDPDKSQGPLKGILAGLGFASAQVYKF